MKKFLSSQKEYNGYIGSLSRRIARTYYNSYLTHKDYFQIGLIALWKACDLWKKERGEFSPYVRASIYHEMVNGAIKSMGVFYAPVTDKILSIKIRKYLSDKKTEEEIAELLGISLVRIEELKRISLSINERHFDPQETRFELDLSELEDVLSEEELCLILTNGEVENRTKKNRMIKTIGEKLRG